jgi:hypothetical protein
VEGLNSMAKLEISTKRLEIVKANAQIVTVVGVAAFVTVFSLVASHAVWSQTQYQSRVTKADNVAHQQLLKNIQAFSSLTSSYQAFDAQSTNIIGGAINGSNPNDGDNAKIILDALPSSYDFPALTSSIEKILSDGNFTVSGITGTDDQLSETSNINASPQPIAMPFGFSVTNANYSAIQQLMTTLQESIRPIQIDSLTLSGGTNSMDLTVSAHTYYQPGKALDITKQEIQRNKKTLL